MWTLKKPSRKDFSDKEDFQEAIRLYHVCDIALEHGTPVEIIREVVKRHEGNFVGLCTLFVWVNTEKGKK